MKNIKGSSYTSPRSDKKTSKSERLKEASSQDVNNQLQSKDSSKANAFSSDTSQVFSITVTALLPSKVAAHSKITILESVPKLPEYLLYLFLTRAERQHIVGDLAEEFREVQLKFGIKPAKLWYYKQVVGSLWPLFRKTVRYVVYGWLLEWVHRHI